MYIAGHYFISFIIFIIIYRIVAIMMNNYFISVIIFIIIYRIVAIMMNIKLN